MDDFDPSFDLALHPKHEGLQCEGRETFRGAYSEGVLRLIEADVSDGLVAEKLFKIGHCTSLLLRPGHKRRCRLHRLLHPP